MTRETITLNARAQWRLYVLNHILAGETSIAEATGLLGLSVRSVRRLLARYRGADGAAALVHGNAGRAPATRDCARNWSSSPGPGTPGSTGNTWPSCWPRTSSSGSPRARCAGCWRRRVCRSCAGDARGVTERGATG